MTTFHDVRDLPLLAVLDGIRARVVHGEQLSFGLFEVAPGAEFPEHSHPNEQIGTVIHGSMLFADGDGLRECGPGDIWSIPGNEVHSGRGGPQGAIVVEVFAPPRGEWREAPLEPPAPPLWP